MAKPKSSKKTAKKTAKKAGKKKAAKKVTKKAGKKTTKKAGTKKAAPSKSSAASNTPATRRHAADQPHTQLEVWDAYSRLRSVSAVVRETGIGKDVVRQVLTQDGARVMRIAQDFLEHYAAGLEASGERALGVVHQALGLAEVFLREVQTAAAEGRATVIRGHDGVPMPVLDVVEFLQNCRILDQAMKVAEKTWQLSRDFRLVQQPRAREETNDTVGAALNFFTMTDYEIAQVLQAGGMELPPVLAEGVKLVEAQKEPADAE